MSPESDTREVLQSSFEELQAHLKQKSGDTPAKDLRPDKAKTAEEVIFDLALKEGFEVRNILGMGGMGAVVKAVDKKLNRTVALKFLPPALIVKEENARKLRQEAELASSINHENVVNILSWHEVENVPFYAMEYIQGENVEELVRRRGRLPAIEALRIALEAANGLEALHKVNIVHRDIKPENIMISQDGRVKITDFGISRTTDHISKEVHEGKIAGSPKFMSPEQARGEAATSHSDMYSLGAVLYFMLTGHAPVESAADVRQLIKNVREGKLVPIEKHLPKLRKEIARSVTRLLSQNPPRRAFNIQTLKQDLAGALLSLNEKERPAIVDFFLRNRKILVPVGTLVLGVAIGVVAGREMVVRKEDGGNPVLRQSLIRVGQAKADALRKIAASETGTDNARSLVGQLGAAVDAGDAERIAELISAVDREMNLWQSLQQIRFVAGDAASPLHDLATRTVSLVPEANSVEMDALLAEWNRSWVDYLTARAVTAPRTTAEDRRGEGWEQMVPGGMETPRQTPPPPVVHADEDRMR